MQCSPSLIRGVLAGSAFMAVSLIPVSAQRPPPRISEDRDLKEFDLSQWECLNQPEGTARTPDGMERNRLKNRSAPESSPDKVQDLDVRGFLQKLAAFDAATVHKRRKDLTAQQRHQLDPLENQLVQITGYLGLAYCGPPETTNCASIDFHDWHLELFEKPLERPPEPGDPTPIICEISPRTENAVFADKVRVQELTGFFRRADLNYEATGHPARKIRVTGYLLWDDEHNGTADVGPNVRRINANKYHNPWRQTAWEIHPVTKIVPVDSPISPAASPSILPVFPTNRSSTASPASETTLVPTATGSASPDVVHSPTPDASSPGPAIQPRFVTITSLVTIKIPYGETTLARGTKAEFVSRDSNTVTIRYLGESVSLPVGSTDLH
jgi:hypothetical protein